MGSDVLAEMLDGTWNFAKLMLSKAGEFYPFGETADESGKRTMQGASTGEKHPEPRALYSLLQDAFAREASEGRAAAVALVANVDIPAEHRAGFKDGIRVHLEAPGHSRFVYLPYRVAPRTALERLFRRPFQVSYAEAFSIDVPPVFFRGGGPTSA